GANDRKNQVRVFGRKVAAALGGPGAHDGGIRALDRLWVQIAFCDLVELALVVERVVLGPQPLDDGAPLLGAGLTLGVSHDRAAEHVDSRLVPSGHDVERVTAAGNMIDDRGLLGGDDRVVERDMRSGEDAGLGGRSRNAGGPGVSLEASALRIGGAAEAVPA